jgi:hypothetical protein
MRRVLFSGLILAWAGIANATVVNERGVAGAPISVHACSVQADEVIPGTPTTSNWSIMPEGADIRCNVGTSANGAASPVPTASVGFLFKSNVLVPETTLNLGSSVGTLRLDCCGVAGAVPVDSWHE